MAIIKDTEKNRLSIKRLTAERSLTMATGAFKDGIEFIRTATETKAMDDSMTI